MPYITGDRFPSSQSASRLAGATDEIPAGPTTGPSAGPAAGPPAPHPEPETRGCLFALSQPPLILFLAVVGMLIFLAAVHDLFLL